MKISRRDFGKITLAGLPVATAMLSSRELFAAPAKFDSHFAGVWIGVIAPYSYRSEGKMGDANAVLNDITTDRISGCEIEAITPETYAGCPPVDGLDGQASPGGIAAMERMMAAMSNPAHRVPVGVHRGPRRPPTAAQKAALKKAQTTLTNWRLKVPMSKFESFRRLYNDAGVSIYAFKLTLAMYMPDDEFDYAFHVTKTLGARALQMEMPTGPGSSELTDRIGQFASKHKMMVGYHAHLDATPDLWNNAMSQSPYNGINLDVGHYVAAGNHDVVQFIIKNHARITTVHLKDRHYPNNTPDSRLNEPWGHGDTPLVKILQTMRDNHYTFPGSIEFEYPIPAGSNAEKEVAKCLAYARHALMS